MEVYNKDGIKLWQGDSLELLKQIPDNSVDLIVTDPPYNTGMTENNTKKENHKTARFSGNCPTWLGNFFNDRYSKKEYNKLVKTITKEFFRVLKDNKAVYIYINWKQLGKWIYFLEKAGFKVKNTVVWDKVVHGLNYQNYAYTHEFIIYAVKGKFEVNNKSINDRNKGYYKDIWHIQRVIDNNTESEHETIKHIEVVRLPILHASNEGDLILDAFLGSGTTAVACKQLNRRCVGIEIVPKYIEIAKKRLEQENIKKYIKQNEVR